MKRNKTKNMLPSTKQHKFSPREFSNSKKTTISSKNCNTHTKY